MVAVIPVTLAIEDAPSEAVVVAAIHQAQLPIKIEQILQKKGATYLRQRADSLNRAAHGGVHSIILADADSSVCPATLAQQWFPGGRHKNLALRFAVRELEAWLLADAVGLARHLRIAVAKVPHDPEALLDAKAALVNLVRMSPRRDLVAAIVPNAHGTARVGTNYNAAVAQFVRSNWDLSRAMQRSPSLVAFVARLSRLAE